VEPVLTNDCRRFQNKTLLQSRRRRFILQKPTSVRLFHCYAGVATGVPIIIRCNVRRLAGKNAVALASLSPRGSPAGSAPRTSGQPKAAAMTVNPIRADVAKAASRETHKVNSDAVVMEKSTIDNLVLLVNRFDLISSRWQSMFLFCSLGLSCGSTVDRGLRMIAMYAVVRPTFIGPSRRKIPSKNAKRPGKFTAS